LFGVETAFLSGHAANDNAGVFIDKDRHSRERGYRRGWGEKV
jgi:hypothetical protein